MTDNKTSITDVNELANSFLNAVEGTEWYIYWTYGNDGERGQGVVIKKAPDFFFPDWMADAVGDKFECSLTTKDGKAALLITVQFIEKDYDMKLFVD